MVWGVDVRSNEMKQREGFVAAYGPPPDALHEQIVQRYMAIDTPEQPVRFSTTMSPYFDIRFMAKIGLGVGYKTLGEGFLHSLWAATLRKALWAKPSVQERLPRLGLRMFEADEQLDHLLGWPGGVLLSLMPLRTHLVFAFNVYGAAYKVIVAKDSSLWSRVADLGEGLVWILIPQRDFFEGPIPLATFIAHAHGALGLPRLREAESWRIDPRALREDETDDLSPQEDSASAVLPLDEGER